MSSSVHATYCLDNRKHAGMRHSLAVVDGAPALLYTVEGRLCFAQAKTPAPASATDWQSSAPYPGEIALSGLLCELNGKPACLIVDQASRAVLFGTAASARPASDKEWKFTKLAGAPAKALILGLDELGGCPVAVMRDQKTKLLQYFQARPLAGGGWQWSGHIVSSTTPCAGGSSRRRLAIVDGKPLIAAVTEDRRLVVFAALTANPQKEADWRLELVDDGKQGEIGRDSFSLAVVAGQLALAWDYLDVYTLLYGWRTADPASGKAIWQKSTVLKWDDYDSGLYLTECSAKPLLIYSYWAQVLAIYGRQEQPASNRDWLMSLVNDAPGHDSTRACAAVVIDGKPVISYYNLKPEGLYITVVERVPR